MTAGRPLWLGGWASAVAADLELLIGAGVPPDEAWDQATEAHRAPGATRDPLGRDKHTPRRPPTRTATVRERVEAWLAEQTEPVTQAQIAEALGVNQATVSQALREVGRAAGRVRTVGTGSAVLWVAK